MTATVTEINASTANNAIPESVPEVVAEQAAPQAEAQAPATPVVERVPITITGVRASGNIEQKLEFNQLQNTPAAETIAQVWHRLAALNAMVFDEIGSINLAVFYPLGSFEKVTVEVGPAIGVSLP